MLAALFLVLVPAALTILFFFAARSLDENKAASDAERLAAGEDVSWGGSSVLGTFLRVLGVLMLIVTLGLCMCSGVMLLGPRF